MDEAQLTGLKQFMVVTVSRATANIATKDDLKSLEIRFDGKIDQLRSEMHEGFAGVREVLEAICGLIDEGKKEVDRRLTRLERRAA